MGEMRVFIDDETGAVTVDWVVLAGVTIGFALLVGSTFAPKMSTATAGVGTMLEDAVSSTLE